MSSVNTNYSSSSSSSSSRSERSSDSSRSSEPRRTLSDSSVVEINVHSSDRPSSSSDATTGTILNIKV